MLRYIKPGRRKKAKKRGSVPFRWQERAKISVFLGTREGQSIRITRKNKEKRRRKSGVFLQTKGLISKRRKLLSKYRIHTMRRKRKKKKGKHDNPTRPKRRAEAWEKERGENKKKKTGKIRPRKPNSGGRRATIKRGEPFVEVNRRARDQLGGGRGPTNKQQMEERPHGWCGKRSLGAPGNERGGERGN